MVSNAATRSEISIPEAVSPVSTRSMGLDTNQLHHEVVQLHVAEGVHHVYVVLDRMPALVGSSEGAGQERA